MSDEDVDLRGMCASLPHCEVASRAAQTKWTAASKCMAAHWKVTTSYKWAINLAISITQSTSCFVRTCYSECKFMWVATPRSGIRADNIVSLLQLDICNPGPHIVAGDSTVRNLNKQCRCCQPGSDNERHLSQSKLSTPALREIYLALSNTRARHTSSPANRMHHCRGPADWCSDIYGPAEF